MWCTAPIFTAVDLAGYAEQLDQEERARMAEGGFSSPEFLRFMQVESLLRVYVCVCVCVCVCVREREREYECICIVSYSNHPATWMIVDSSQSK